MPQIAKAFLTISRLFRFCEGISYFQINVTLSYALSRGSRGKAVDMGSRLLDERSRVRVSVETTDFFLISKSQTGCGAHTASYLVGKWVHSWA
jgi:hypothetical protein